MEDYVQSLTTLCTPHKGSPVASSILKLPKWMLKIIAFWINFWYRIFGDKKPDSLTVCKELALVDDIEKETFKISKSIYCQSYSTKMNRAKDDFIMGIPLAFFHYFIKETETDGLVGEDSTKFGEYKGLAFNDSISHSEIIDFFVTKKKRDRIYKFYSHICLDLAKRGF
jgi:triacylglycerol lipase